MKYSLYFHIPFCQHRCHYCDFITFTGKESSIPAYIDALIEEFRIVLSDKPEMKVHSVYLGGGTPSIIPLSLHEKLFTELNESGMLTKDCEISLEANPGTLSLDFLEGLREIGINRISIGVQSTDSFDLSRLDRIHTIDDVLNSFRNARKAGFDNINLDMIFALPWQSFSGWENSLSRAIDLHPEHFSLYSLIVEPGTQLFDWYQRGLIKTQDQDLEGDMFERAMEMLERAGYRHYEISNWAKRDNKQDYRCRHNLQYWLNQPYLGFGAGAHGYAESLRTVNVRTISEYISRINLSGNSQRNFPVSPGNVTTTNIDEETQMKDFMMLGLRLVREGVSCERFESWYGKAMTDVFSREINSLLDRGLAEWVRDGHLRLTKRGVMLANLAFMEFV